VVLPQLPLSRLRSDTMVAGMVGFSALSPQKSFVILPGLVLGVAGPFGHPAYLFLEKASEVDP